jgi:hypothetical protein
VGTGAALPKSSREPSAIVAAPAGTQARSGYARLEALVRDFDRDARESRRLIRELLDQDRAGFCASALEVVKRYGDSRGSQYLVVLLMANNLLLDALCHPALSRAEALQLAKVAAQVDPTVDISLAKQLADSNEAVAPAHAPRLVEILAEISDGNRILPWMSQLLRHSNPHLRSKAVLLIGRGSRSVRWAQKRLSESDPRVRANAVEALWGVDTEEARTLLQQASRDGNNRVAGNALRGLYGLGDCTVFPEVLSMAAHESGLFPSTAAWVMGETGDPRFTEVLGGLLRDPSPAVRKRAFSALAGIKAAAARVFRSSELRISARFSANYNGKEARRLRATVISPDGAEHGDVLPTQFILAEDRRQIYDYSVAVHQVPAAMSVAFILPGEAALPGTPWSEAAVQCTGWKRPADLWAAAPYHNEVEAPGADANEPLVYSPDPEPAAAALRGAGGPPREDMWTALWRSVRGENGYGRGRRHVIIFSREPACRQAGHGIVSAVLNTATTIQAISTVENPALEDFCRRVQGCFQLAASEQELPALVEQAYLTLRARYTITYQTAGPEAHSLLLRVHSPGGWGKTEITIQ